MDPEHWYIHHSSKIKKVIKQSQNSRNEGFSDYFFLMMEGYAAGSVLVTSGSGCGSGRPKNILFVPVRLVVGQYSDPLHDELS